MIKREDIDKLAELSRLELSEDEKTNFETNINNILEYVGQIGEVASDGAEREVGDVRNVMREDGGVIEPGKYTEVILNEAPQREGDYVSVKKILSND